MALASKFLESDPCQVASIESIIVIDFKLRMGKVLSLFKPFNEPIVAEDNDSIDKAISHILE